MVQEIHEFETTQRVPNKPKPHIMFLKTSAPRDLYKMTLNRANGLKFFAMQHRNCALDGSMHITVAKRGLVRIIFVALELESFL